MSTDRQTDRQTDKQSHRQTLLKTISAQVVKKLKTVCPQLAHMSARHLSMGVTHSDALLYAAMQNISQALAQKLQ